MVLEEAAEWANVEGFGDAVGSLGGQDGLLYEVAAG